MSGLKIWKSIFEIRYPAASLLFDNRGKIAAKWQWTSDLTEWRISNNQVSIYNKSNTCSLIAGYKNCSVVMEMPENIDTFCTQALDFSNFVLDTIGIKKIDRIGLRLMQIAKHQHFKLLFNKMQKQLFLMTDEDWESFGAIPEDIGLPLTLSMGEYTANFPLGPMRKSQLENYFDAPTIKQKVPSVALFLDIEFFRNNQDINLSNLHGQIDNFLVDSSKAILDLSAKFINKYRGFK